MILQGLRAIIAVVTVHVLMTLQAAAAEPVPDLHEHLSIPIRWCGVRGSPAVEVPAKVGESTTDGVLRARHGRATVFVWLREARISFRSAITTQLHDQPGFPVIDDPHPPKKDGSGGPGVEGDILDPHFDRANAHELNAAIASCEAAWAQLENRFDTNVEGIIAINIRRFVKPDGTPSQLSGIGSSMHTVPHGTDKCALPSDLATYDPFGSNDGWVVVEDNRFTFADDPHDSVLAHELGHVLFLGHGNGIDDPLGNPPRTNERYDAFCDHQEDVHAAPATLMGPRRPVPNRLTPLQREHARAVARVTVGGVIVKMGDLQSGYILSDDAVDKVRDVKDPSVDLKSLGIKYNTVKGTTLVSFKLVGRLPAHPNHRFLVFADLDADPKTGGEPAALGFQTRFQGAEFVTEVAVTTREGEEQLRIVPTAWMYRSGGFAKLPPDSGITADVSPAVAGHTGKAIHDVVSVQIPHTLVSPRPVLVRFQAQAQRIGGELDRLPNEPDQALLIRLTKPIYPVCQAIPPTAGPGSRITIEAMGFPHGRDVQILYNEKLLGKGSTDRRGRMSLQLPVPDHVKDGFYLLVVREVGTALTAHCAVTIDSALAVKSTPGDALVR